MQCELLTLVIHSLPLFWLSKIAEYDAWIERHKPLKTSISVHIRLAGEKQRCTDTAPWILT